MRPPPELVRLIRDLFDSGRPEHRRYALAAFGVRLAMLLAGLALVELPARHHPLWVILTSIGALVAVINPAGAGAGLALGSAIGGWFAGFGWHGAPPLAATVGFALSLYVLHTATALAAAVPLSTQLRAPVLGRWSRRCLLELAVAGVLAATSYGLGRPAGSDLLQLLGLLGVLVLIGVPVLLLNRSER
jgi:hypothetical protein